MQRQIRLTKGREMLDSARRQSFGQNLSCLTGLVVPAHLAAERCFPYRRGKPSPSHCLRGVLRMFALGLYQEMVLRTKLASILL